MAGVLHKTNFMYVVIFHVWISVCRGGRRWSAPGPLLGLSSAGFGRPLGRSWAAPGLSWGLLGPPGASWGLLGLLLDRVWAPARVLLVAALAAFGRPWACQGDLDAQTDVFVKSAVDSGAPFLVGWLAGWLAALGAPGPAKAIWMPKRTFL